jgi:hypothetical protein
LYSKARRIRIENEARKRAFSAPEKPQLFADSCARRASLSFAAALLWTLQTQVIGVAFIVAGGRFAALLLGAAYYGEGYQENEYIDKWTWRESYIYAMFDYNEFSEKSEFIIFYLPILNEQRADSAQKAKEAHKDFE